MSFRCGAPQPGSILAVATGCTHQKDLDKRCDWDPSRNGYYNKNSETVGPTDTVCFEIFQPKNDHDFFKYEMHAYNWTICQNLDAQRDELGLNPVTNCTTPLLPFHLLPTNEISCE